MADTTRVPTEQEETLTEAYHDFEKGMNIHARFKVSDFALGEDMVQDTFMKTWRYLLKGGKIDIMKAFLYHILNNLIVDEYRKRKHATTSLDALLEKGFEPTIDITRKMLDGLDGKVALLLIQDLPIKYQTVMRMRFVQSLTLKEIALLTNQSKNAVAVQLHRGLAQLKILYHGVGKQE
jgi:RNA polymerase sigma factor (sigma-70 family)